MVQAFVDLIRRHEQAFYSFVHKVHSKGEGLFSDFIRWIELFLTILRDGLGEGLSIEFLLPYNGEEREKIIAEVDKVVLYHYKLKILYEEKLRRRFGRVQGNSAADAEDAAAHDLLDSVTGDLNFGELASGDAVDVAAQQTDEESSSEEYSTSEESSDESDSQLSTVEKAPSKSLPISPSSSKSTFQTFQSSQTLVAQPVPYPRQPNPTTVPSPGSSTRRNRSLSLRSVRSLMSLNSPHRSTPPPVPPLPDSVKNTGSIYSKPLPARPGLPPSQASSSRTVLPHPRRSPSQMPHQRQRPKPDSKGQRTLIPPELELIPQLLPVFVEMVSVLRS